MSEISTEATRIVNELLDSIAGTATFLRIAHDLKLEDPQGKLPGVEVVSYVLKWITQDRFPTPVPPVDDKMSDVERRQAEARAIRLPEIETTFGKDPEPWYGYMSRPGFRNRRGRIRPDKSPGRDRKALVLPVHMGEPRIGDEVISTVHSTGLLTVVSPVMDWNGERRVVCTRQDGSDLLLSTEELQRAPTVHRLRVGVTPLVASIDVKARTRASAIAKLKDSIR